jgi:hypothetical protein
VLVVDERESPEHFQRCSRATSDSQP